MAYDYSDVINSSSMQETRNKYAEYFVDNSSSTTLSIETFFSLLMAEMSNQDPLEPTSNTEFVAQLANFTALQNSSNTLYYNTVSYAASLAGKTVTVATSDGGKGLLIDTGVVTGVDISDGTNIELVINGKRYSLGSVMNVAGSGSSSYPTSSSDGAYAVSLIGKKVTLVAETANGGLIDEGIVESIEVEDGEFRVVVNGYSYALSDIIKVNNADAGTSASQTGSTGSTGSTDDTESEETETGNTETSIMEDNED